MQDGIRSIQERILDVVLKARSLALSERDVDSCSEAVNREGARLVELGDGALDCLGEVEKALKAPHLEKALSEGLLQVVALLRRQLTSKKASLSKALRDSDPLFVANHAEDLSHEIVRGLCAIEKGLASAYNVVAATRYVNLLREALGVRKAIARFQQGVLNGHERKGQSQDALLHAAATSLAVLLLRDEFESLPLLHRLTLKKLQARILQWARGSDRDPEEQRRLLEEIQAVAVMLGAVNHDELLVEHDRSLVAGLIDKVSERDPVDELSNSVLDIAAKLRGRDREIDALIEQGTSYHELLAHLLKVHQTLGRF